jgi:5'-phosphate synthase pdxT subunit
MDKLTIGILALQGAFAKHAAVIESLGEEALLVKKPHELDLCDALIIPGGESTAMTIQMEYCGLVDKIREFAEEKPIWGTCAGLILMARSSSSRHVCSFGLLEIDVDRNAYGRQTESFTTELDVDLNGELKKFKALFIRAPIISTWDKNSIKVLSQYEDHPVLVEQGIHLGSTFHPELAGNGLIHDYFLSNVRRTLNRL